MAACADVHNEAGTIAACIGEVELTVLLVDLKLVLFGDLLSLYLRGGIEHGLAFVVGFGLLVDRLVVAARASRGRDDLMGIGVDLLISRRNDRIVIESRDRFRNFFLADGANENSVSVLFASRSFLIFNHIVLMPQCFKFEGGFIIRIVGNVLYFFAARALVGPGTIFLASGSYILFGNFDPIMLNGLQFDLDGEAEIIRMALAVGVFADPVDVSRSLAAGIDIAVIGFAVTFSTLFELLDVRLSLSLYGIDRQEVGLLLGNGLTVCQSSFLMSANSADEVLGSGDLVHGEVDLIAILPNEALGAVFIRIVVTGSLVSSLESSPLLIGHGLGLFIGGFEDELILANSANKDSVAVLGAVRSNRLLIHRRHPIVGMTVSRDLNGLTLRVAVLAGIHCGTGFGAGSRLHRDRVLFIPIMTFLRINDVLRREGLAATVLAVVNEVIGTVGGASRLFDIFLNGLISGDMVELIDGEGDGSVAVDAAIDLSAGSFAGRRDFDDGGLGIELMIYADMFDIAGADLIEGLLDGGDGIGDTGDGGSGSLSGDVLGADEACDLIEDGLNVFDDGIDIGAIAVDVKGADDRIDISLDFSHLRSEIGEGSGKFIEVGIEEGGHLRAKLIPIDDGTTIRAGAEVVGFRVDMLTGGEQETGNGQHKQSNHGDH